METLFPKKDDWDLGLRPTHVLGVAFGHPHPTLNLVEEQEPKA
jgi:hypothetical protein